MKRPWAVPLVPLYWAGLTLDRALTRRQRLRWPVISVGSLSAGGAGKTPIVKLLAGLLKQSKTPVSILSRGYGRSSRKIERVDPNGDARRFGDEPLEMARDGLTVFVGSDRFAAGKLAESDGEPRIHLLDDGFQHGALARCLDVVLLTLDDVTDTLLPAGNRREPLHALERADVLVLRSEEAATIREALPHLAEKECWKVQRRLLLPATLSGRQLAFCGLARPENFVSMLAGESCDVAASVCFPDHHAYSFADIHALVARANDHEAASFVTTAKDAVKLTPAMLEVLNRIGPVHVPELQVTLLEEAAALMRLQPLIHRLRNTAP